MKPRRLFTLVTLVAMPLGLLAYKELPPPEKVVLPPAKSAADSLASIKVPADLQVELVAAEPLTMDPIDLAWDAKGRMWVLEMADYPLGLDGKGKPGGRIRFLESTRGDGRYDKSTLFADGLNFPSGFAVWRNGVIVVAVPDILFLEDTDGDGRADKATKLYTGVAEGNQQHLANGLQWGLDGWLHLGNGNSGGKVKSEKTGVVLDIGTRDFRIQPDTGAIEALAGHSQYGLNRDDWGNWFGCNNSNPIWHYVLEDRYLRRNPHLVPPNSTVTVSVTPGAAPVFPRSETLARFNDPQGHNHFTSACGVMIYRDDFLGREYAGNVFVCEPVHNLMHREIIRPAGATFASQRAASEKESEVFASTDNWSRFAAVRAGPDGALYIADMYRMVIEHPKWIPDAWQKQLGDLRAGADKGRIYRLRPKNVALRTMPKLAGSDVVALVAALENPSGTVRDLAQKELVWRGDKSATEALQRLVRESSRPESRAQALATLALLGTLAPQGVGHALEDSHPGVRRVALQLSERLADRVPELLPSVAALADDKDAAVRLQAACTLGEWKQPAAGVALAKLVRADEDRFIRAAAMSSAMPHADTILAQLGAGGRSDDPVIVEIATVTQNAKALASMLAAIAASRGSADVVAQFNSLARLLDWLQRNNKTLAQLQSAGGEAGMREALEATDRIFDNARAMVANTQAPMAQRVAAVQVIGRGRTRQNDDFDALIKLITPQSPVELQLASLTALGRMTRNNVAERLLAGWSGYSPKIRGAVLDLALSRPAWAQVLLDRAEADKDFLAQIDAAHGLALKQHSNGRVAERAAAIFGAGLDANRQKVIDRYLAAQPGLTPNPVKGAEVFAAICSACHKSGDVPGRAIGPDLASVKDRTPQYLIPHILDPNRAVEDRYVLYTATTQDGRAFAGMLAGETGSSITIIGLDGTEQAILRSDVRSLTSTGRSLMPDGLEATINEQAMADLVAFLAGGGKTN